MDSFRHTNMDQLVEQKLLQNAINGDQQAFSELLEQHYMMIYRTAYKWCGNQQDAEDITQDVCIKLGASLTSFHMDCRFSTWVYRITINTAKDLIRKRKDHIDIDDIVSMESTAEHSPENCAQWRELWHFVGQLPERECEAILLVYSEQMSHSEVANIMQCAESTVSWYIHVAKKKLIKRMNNADEQ